MALSLSLSLSLLLSLTLLQPSKASAQYSVLCRRKGGTQHTVPEDQNHPMINLRYQSLGTKLVPTHRSRRVPITNKPGTVLTKHLAWLGWLLPPGWEGSCYTHMLEGILRSTLTYQTRLPIKAIR